MPQEMGIASALVYVQERCALLARFHNLRKEIVSWQKHSHHKVI